ncbi:FkbM family methyltransferase [Ancylobacter mangrovi]|uniref:FkbM family methyltransferase n=1 Tax=Ancylobacter mangrovi TaxID=2972472 RepID=A0A9X2PGR3_9HYPH|nr:FkbM family methyltransferase [Ancylobacter mangrovi]MCS0496741.1 FkbM family methyltransferase [Ancylobacter mangrovi]MCS0504935.1 FkbM family methyltransferase [Ancylobacter mangrovi]
MAAIGRDAFPALFDLDRKMLNYLPGKNGTFIEVGANDGISQSNTWYLEAYRQWSGLLIEPVPELAGLARRFRKAPVANVALGPKERDGDTLELSVSDLTTTVANGEKKRSRATASSITVPVRALSSLLTEHGIDKVDFFSLDVEGFEIPVLQGLDFERHKPRYILVETEMLPEVEEYLKPWYRLKDTLTFHDYLFEDRSIE